MVTEGDVTVGNAEEAAAQSGVTEITGDLSIQTAEGLEAFDCLETVGGVVELSPFGFDGSLSVLRNLRSVGRQLEVTPGSFDSVDITCSLSSLDSVGEALATGRRLTVTGGATGVLDVSTLTSIEHFLFRDTLLTRIVLPSNRPFSIGQFEVERNDELHEISGFDGVELTMSGGTLQLRVVDNPLLSTCWANDLGARFQAAYEFAGVTISGNAPDCP